MIEQITVRKDMRKQLTGNLGRLNFHLLSSIMNTDY